MGRFGVCFGAMEDPRAPNARHDLAEVLFIAVAACICGAESCVDMAEFGLAKEPLFRQVLRLEHGIPSHDTFSRLFRLLDPARFHAAFQRFMAEFARAAALTAGEEGVVALDGVRFDLLAGEVHPRRLAPARGQCLGLRHTARPGPMRCQ